MPLQIIQRRDYLQNWKNAELQSPPKGNLRRGEIAIAIVTDDNTENGDIVEVIGRIGPSDTPTPFSDCPVVFRSPRGFKGEDVRPVLVDEDPAVDSVLAYDATNNKFVSLDEDPGTYEDDQGGTEGGGTEGGGTEGGGGELSEVSPSILVLSATGLTGSQTAGSRADYTLSMEVVGRPQPILSIEIIERDYPDSTNGFNYTESTAYTFTTDDPPQNVTVTTSTDSSVSAALGSTNYTISGLGVLRAEAIEKVGVSVRVSASNTAGESPVSEFAAGSIAIVADPTGVTPEPRLTKVSISEGGSETSKIDNPATDASVTLTANYVAADFTDGVDNGAVSYQWLSDGAELVGETGSSLTLTNTADSLNDSQVQVVVTIANDHGTNTRSAFMAIGDYDEGFTEFSPAADSRLIYVAQDGDDAAAATVKGRGYYLPSDPEIGPDPTNPVGPIVAYGSWFEGVKRVRLSGTIGDLPDGRPNYPYNKKEAISGYPDWLLLKRGGSYLDDPTLTVTGVNKVYNIGGVLGGDKGAGNGWHNGRERVWHTCGPWRGRSASEPAVVTAWGNESDPRPKVTSFTVSGSQRHTRITSLDVQGGLSWGFQGDGDGVNNASGDILIEDVKATTFGGLNVNAGPLMTYDRGLVLRRCVVADTFSPHGHNQGFYFTGGMSAMLTVEECVFDRNGYKEDPNEPTTWMGNIVGDGLAPGTGVQPRRTYYDRNLYLSTGAQFTLRGNIVSRGGGGSAVQMRTGGVAERNLFIWNGSALGMSHPEGFGHAGSLIKDNLVLHDDHMLPPGGFGQGISGSGWDDDVAVIDGNILAHFHRHNNGGATLWAEGKKYSAKTPFEHVLPNAFILNNAIYREYSGIGIEIPPTTHTFGVASATVSNNQVSTPWGLSFQGDPSKPATYTYSGNRFHGDGDDDQFRWGYHYNGNRVWRKGPYTEGTFADWQAAGFDTDGTFTTDFAAFKASVGWIEPERDIVSYMQAVDPTYVVNEDVYVDDGSTGQKQAVRQKVWEVLMRDINRGRLPEDRAKEIARRYHAFITFIEKARNNRKGAYDLRWTADAVNNYIREGFGKPPVGGPYTATIDDLTTYGASV